jgi:hypothetical protein
MKVNPGDPDISPMDIAQALKDKVRPMAVNPVIQKVSNQDRIAVVLTAYMQPNDESAVGYDVRCSSNVASSGKREFLEKLSVGEDDIPLPLGQYEKPGSSSIILIENRTGHGRRVNPTAQQLTEDKEAVIVVKRRKTILGYVRKGFPFFGELESPHEVTLRCQSGVAQARVVVFPKMG